MKQLKLGNISIDFVRKNIKNIHLAVYPPTGRVRIAVPISVKDESVKLFVISKLGWIKKHQRKFESQERQPERKYISRETHYFLGKRYLLKVIISNEPIQVTLSGKFHIKLYVKIDTSESRKQEIMNDWYRKELKKIMSKIISKWEKIIGVEVSDYGVKKMKTKWGTCIIEKKRIWLNLELAKKPIQCIEYLIVHEMIHLLERKHNEFFVNHMNNFMPNWKAYKNELNRLPVSHSDWNY